ncbi:EAL domain-containing protein [Algicola sagamiensis]|uniref:EAL domain-containing protein n=1 Tax=Algicola sagamiensis TaxID=163869 RepID=UPI000378CF48|nr:EAL domain-containing protein [Algicola sagamiensis]
MRAWISSLITSLSHQHGQAYLDALGVSLAQAVEAQALAVVHFERVDCMMKVDTWIESGQAYTCDLVRCQDKQDKDRCGAEFFRNAANRIFKDKLPYAQYCDASAFQMYAYPMLDVNGIESGAIIAFFSTELSELDESLLSTYFQFCATLIVNEQSRVEALALLERERCLLANAQKTAKEGSWSWSLISDDLYCSPNLFSIYQLKEISLEYYDLMGLSHPDDQERVNRAILCALGSDEAVFDVEHRIVTPKGEEKQVRQTGYIVRDDLDVAVRIDGVVRDLTESKQVNAELQLAKVIYDYASEAIISTNEEKVILSVNEAFRRITGYQDEDVVGKHATSLSSGKHSDSFFHDIEKCLAETGGWEGEIWSRRKSGEAFPEQLKIKAIRNATGQAEKYLYIFSDISAQKSAEAKVEYRENYDALTRLPNRALFIDRLKQTIIQEKQRDGQFCLIVIDLDQFKTINESLGHAIGDDLLRAVARRLVSSVKQEDTVARLSGDEFAIITRSTTDVEGAHKLASSLQQAMNMPFKLSLGRMIYISASMGVAIYPQDGANVSRLMSVCDQAVFLAKSIGRNTYSFSSQQNIKRPERQLLLRNALKEAIEHQDISLKYQPIYHFNEPDQFQFEVLARWKHETLGWIEPSEFIHIAEVSGLMSDLGKHILVRACNDLNELQLLGFEGVCFHVNRSVQEFLQPSLCLSILEKIFAKTKIKPEQVAFEIQESLLLSDESNIEEILLELKRRGHSIAIDDFGVGFSSLSHLRKFPIDTIKIDEVFIHEMEQSTQDYIMVKSIIDMAKAFQKKVIAEGVETQTQADLLHNMGCDAYQGYFQQEPMPFSEVIDWLRHQDDA